MGFARHLAVHRPRTTAAGRVTLHSLSFGPHYDPGNVVFGGLIAHKFGHRAARSEKETRGAHARARETP